MEAKVLGFVGSSSRNPSDKNAFTACMSNELSVPSLTTSALATPIKKKPMILKERNLNILGLKRMHQDQNLFWRLPLTRKFLSLVMTC